MTFRGHMQNGVVILDEPAVLPEGCAVRVELEQPADDIRSLREGLLAFAGTVTDWPQDMARNHDHYIHGTPKR